MVWFLIGLGAGLGTSILIQKIFKNDIEMLPICVVEWTGGVLKWKH